MQVINYFLFAITGVISVISFEYLNNDLTNEVLFNDYIDIDRWFFIHVLSTSLLAILFKKELNFYNYWGIIFGWEVIENIILPNIHPYFFSWKEKPINIIWDLIAALPASLIL